MRDDVDVLSGGELLLSGPAVGWFASAVQLIMNAHRGQNGGSRDPRLERWLGVAEVALIRQRASANGRLELPTQPDLSVCTPVDPITTSEAADMLECTSRNVLDLRTRGAFPTARKRAGRWQFERSEVAVRASEAN